MCPILIFKFKLKFKCGCRDFLWYDKDINHFSFIEILHTVIFVGSFTLKQFSGKKDLRLNNQNGIFKYTTTLK